MLNVISLGAGVQSTTMALMAAHGEIGPMPDAAIFANTKNEPRVVYQHLEWLKTKLPYPVYEVTQGDLWKSATRVRRTEDGERSYIQTAIPVFTAEGLRKGKGQRHCTRDFKVAPINREVRRLSGLRRVLRKHGVIAEIWIGISTDEASRRKDNTKTYLRSRWPLLELNMERQDCFDWMEARGYPRPPRSACTFCPFHDDNSWLALEPDEFADAVLKEKQLQAAYIATDRLTATPYFHDTRVPLSEVTLVPTAETHQPGRVNKYINECEGMCGI